MRLIDADELKKNFQDELCKGIACAECSMQAGGFCRAERWIDIAPTIDAEPKHGRWIKNPPTEAWEYHCSLCGTQEDYKENYCRNCGARMDESEAEE